MLCRDLHVGQTLHISRDNELIEVRLLHKTGRSARLSINASPDVKIRVVENQTTDAGVVMQKEQGA